MHLRISMQFIGIDMMAQPEIPSCNLAGFMLLFLLFVWFSANICFVVQVLNQWLYEAIKSLFNID